MFAAAINATANVTPTEIIFRVRRPSRDRRLRISRSRIVEVFSQFYHFEISEYYHFECFRYFNQ
jgi:hypothetical protein